MGLDEVKPGISDPTSPKPIFDLLLCNKFTIRMNLYILCIHILIFELNCPGKSAKSDYSEIVRTRASLNSAFASYHRHILLRIQIQENRRGNCFQNCKQHLDFVRYIDDYDQKDVQRNPPSWIAKRGVIRFTTASDPGNPLPQAGRRTFRHCIPSM
jgi:hypothetical protein